LGEVTTKIGSGKTPKGGSSVYLRHGIPLLRSQNITNDAVDLSDVVYISDEMDSEMANSRVQIKDVLLNITGASIGRSAVYKHTTTANVNQHVCIVRPTQDVNAEYLQLNLTSPNGQQQIDNNQAGGGREGLNFQQIAKIEFHFPTLPEQTAIGTFFRTLDELRAATQRKVTLLKQLKAAYLQQMFPQARERVPRVRFGGFTEPWEQKKLEYYFVERSERSGNGELISVTINFGVVKASELDRQIISSDDKSNYKSVKIDDIAYNSMRMWQGASGYSQYDGILSPAYTVITPNEVAHSPFFAYLFKKLDMIQIFQRNSQGLTSDTWNLKFPAFSQIEVYAPLVDEQKVIANFFKLLDDKIDVNAQRIAQLQQLKSAYLQKMFV